MKLFLTTLLIALQVHAGDIVFIKNDHHKKYQAAENLLVHGNDLEAIQKFKHLLNIDKQNEIYLLDKLSKIHATNKLTNRFILFLNDKIAQSPFDANLNHQLVTEYLALQQPTEACEKAKFMLPHVANKENFYAVLADCSLAIDRPDDAVSYLNKLITDRSEIALNLKRAEVHLKLNNLPLAKSDLDFYFLKAKPNEKAYLLQAELLTKQQLSEKLPELFKRCLDVLGVSQPCFLGYLNATKTLNATFKVEHFNQHVTAYQDHSAIVIEIGRYHQQLKNFDLAENIYSLAHGKNPEKIEPVTMLFDLYRQQNQSQKAFDVLSSFIAKSGSPTDIQTAKNLQETLFQKNNSENATPALVQAEPLPSDSDRQLYLAKKYSEILPRLKKIKVKSDTEYFLLGNIYYFLNSYSNAKLSWSKVKTQSNLYPKAVFNTAAVMRVENMLTAANNLFNSTEFPAGMNMQTKKFAELLGHFPKRLPASEQKKVDELFKALLYLDWEP